MFDVLKSMLGIAPADNFAELIQKGAQIIDVRTEMEYKTGHIPGSVNIPLDRLAQQLGKLTKDKPFITCCASGMRSASARQLMRSNGFTEVYNGGGWASLQHKLR
ncbi:MAG TPA: rhodanese-like domain-containing protein [Sediminibacterium sp.]|nr:rhodanese-like domain-containing protein [Sediminibacterium sp.]